METIAIGNRLEPMWDSYLIDTEKTTAEFRVGHPVRRETVMRFDEPWEGDGEIYFNVVRVGNKYRMYYNNCCAGYNAVKPTFVPGICCLESADGLTWTKPKLGLVEANGDRENNIVLTGEMIPECFPEGGSYYIDNFFVMRDENPNPVVKYPYKAFCRGLAKDDGTGGWRADLHAFGSNDGLHFEYIGLVSENGKFDSLNTVHWNAQEGCYVAYVRDFHERRTPMDNAGVLTEPMGVRDVRVMRSKDFRCWSEPEELIFDADEEFPMYTNNIQPYPRAPHLLVGFPTRYVERREWFPNFDRLCGRAFRELRSKADRREGTAVTDCVFICGHEPGRFTRYDEAFLPPDPENGRNWVYGDMYPCYGLIETPSAVSGADEEYSLYIPETHCEPAVVSLNRYTIRKDGFASLHASFGPHKIVTKPLTFAGNTMKLNFATSARGYIEITVRDTETGAEVKSFEIFGNRVDRIIDFDGDLAAFAGEPVVIEMTLSDADVYAFRFE